MERVEFEPRIVEPGPGQTQRELNDGEYEIPVMPEDLYGMKNQVIVEEEKKEPKTLAIGEYEIGSEDIIYVFDESKRMGIKFTSKSPRSALSLGVFETYPQSISTVEWNDSINYLENRPTSMKVRGGEVTVMTYVVSKEGFFRIISELIRQSKNYRIVINVSMNELQNKQYYENAVKNDRLELERIKRDLLNSFVRNNSQQDFDMDIEKNNLNFDSPKDLNQSLNDLPASDYSSIYDDDKYSGFWDEYNDVNKKL